MWSIVHRIIAVLGGVSLTYPLNARPVAVLEIFLIAGSGVMATFNEASAQSESRSRYSYDVVWRTDDGEIHRKGSFVFFSDKALAKGVEFTGLFSKAECQNKGVVIPKNAAPIEYSVEFSKFSATYTADGRDHTVRVTEISRLSGGKGWTKIHEYVLRLQNGACQLLAYRDGIRDDSAERNMPIRLGNNDLYRCEQLALNSFEEPKAFSSSLPCSRR